MFAVLGRTGDAIRIEAWAGGHWALKTVLIGICFRLVLAIRRYNLQRKQMAEAAIGRQLPGDGGIFLVLPCVPGASER